MTMAYSIALRMDPQFNHITFWVQMGNVLLWNDLHLLNALDGYNFLNIMNLK